MKKLELYKKYRPTNLDQVVGQVDAVKTVKSLLKGKDFPHALLLTGPSGCGKTTIARILANELNCDVEFDFNEINGSDKGGIKEIRDMRDGMNRLPMSPKSKCKIWLIDEGHGLTKDAQNCILKMLEDTPQHVYIIIATTDPRKLLPTVLTRCTEIKVKPVDNNTLEQLLKEVAKSEGMKIDPKVFRRIVSVSNNSPRQALVKLHQIRGLKSTKEMLDAVFSSSMEESAINLARLLIRPETNWATLAPVVKELDDNAEEVRRLVLNYVNAIVCNGKVWPRLQAILVAFRDNFYDCGKAGLSLACIESVARR